MTQRMIEPITRHLSFWKYAAGRLGVAALLLLSVGGASKMRIASGQDQKGPVPLTPKAEALIDPTGYWVSIVDEDWRWRMLTPQKGDYASVPLNAEGKRVADTWDPVKDEREGNQCRAYGAAGIMRIPERLHITWADDKTLRIDTDAGMQARLLHFDGSKWRGGAAQWQGDSAAVWEKMSQRKYTVTLGGPVPGKGGTLKVVTTHMRPGYLRKNGVPYTGSAVLTEYYDRFDYKDDSYLLVTSIVEDPAYLTTPFVTSSQFKRETDASKWNPSPCRPLWPRPPALVKGAF